MKIAPSGRRLRDDPSIVTTLGSERWDCPVCGAESTQQAMYSSNTFGGPPDLDTRPGEMLRSTLPLWVWRCPGCGYVVSTEVQPDPREPAHDQAILLVGSERYQAQLRDATLPHLANSLLCLAMINERCDRLGMAGFSALWAAWACDDAADERGARQCRERALEILEAAQAADQSLIEDGFSAEQLLLADINRRAGHFADARRCCHRGLSGRPEEPIRSLLEFEIELITGEDTAAHSVGEVLAP